VTGVIRAITGLLGAASLALCAAPAASAAGLAYETGGAKNPPEVWVADASGANAHRLGPGAFPVLSPNGGMVAASLGVVTGKTAALAIYPAGGGKAHTFFNINQEAAVAVAWSPDSRYLAVGLLDTTPTRKIGHSAVVIIDTQTFKVTKIASGIVQGVTFAPTAPDTLAYGLSASQNFGSKTNLFSVPAAGGSPTQLTTDGHSYNPVWGKLGIAYDEVNVVKNKAPAYSIFLLNNGHKTQITHQKVTLLQDGLMPISISADGRHLLANFVGEDTENAVTVDLVTHRTHTLKVSAVPPVGFAISKDGKRVLIDFGGFQGPAQHGTVEWVPFAGGKPTVLHKHGDEPSWNQ
jgi:Tol biopolymer transport system component